MSTIALLVATPAAGQGSSDEGRAEDDELGLLIPLELTTRIRSRPRPHASGGTKLDWLQDLRLPNFEMRLSDAVVAQLETIREPGWWHDAMRRWIAKSGRYEKMIRRILREEGVPEDLLYVAMIESTFNPKARSPAGAAGLWQFMPAAAQEGGLRFDHWVDQRLDPERSTRAAARGLKVLNERLGSWELSLAAYNMGYYGLRATIRTYNSNDYWLLRSYEYALPSETRNYVPRILAAAVVGRNLERFGYGDLEKEPGESAEILTVPRSLGLGRLSRLLGCDRSMLEQLNPALRRGRTPAGPVPYELRVPVGTAKLAAPRLGVEVGEDEDDLTQHKVRVGEDLEAIAATLGISRAKLAQLNEISPRAEVEPGTYLVVPAQSARGAPADSEGEPVSSVIPPKRFVYRDRRRVFYETVAGDTLSRVADAFEVTPEELVMWNALDVSAALQPGLVLQVFVSTSFDGWSSVRFLSEGRVRVFLAGSTELYEELAARRERRRILYHAKQGDTLKRLSRRFDLGIGSIRRINHFSNRHEISPGDEVVLYVEPSRSPETRRERRRTERPRAAPGAVQATGAEDRSAPTGLAIESLRPVAGQLLETLPEAPRYEPGSSDAGTEEREGSPSPEDSQLLGGAGGDADVTEADAQGLEPSDP